MNTIAELNSAHRRLQYMMQRSDQWHALKYICDDLTMSFACRMYSIFAMTCLINSTLFNRFKEGLVVSSALSTPSWWGLSGSTYGRSPQG